MENNNRDKKGKFIKGCSGNPAGRPKKPRIEKLEEAIKEVEKDQGKDLFKHFVERAFVSDQVLAVLFKKIQPDLRQTDTNIYDGRLQENLRNEKVQIDKQIATAKALDDAPNAMAM